MRVEWLNAERTQGRVTRGYLWWRRSAQVKYTDTQYGSRKAWFYSLSGEHVGDRLNAWLDLRRVWQPRAVLPEAKVVS